MNQFNLDRRMSSVVVACLAAATVLAYVVYAWVPLATGGSRHITQRDVASYRCAVRKLVAISGSGEVPTYEEALKTLVVTMAQYELLTKKGMKIDPERTNQYILDMTPLKGTLKSLREELGDDRYFFTVTLPAAVGRPFADYYNISDPKISKASSILKDAMATSLQTAASKAGIPTQEIEIPLAQENSALARVVDQSLGHVLNKLVDNGTSVLVVLPKEKLSDKILASVISIPKTPPTEFLRYELAAQRIPLTVKPWALYASNNFFETSMPKGDSPDAKK